MCRQRGGYRTRVLPCICALLLVVAGCFWLQATQALASAAAVRRGGAPGSARGKLQAHTLPLRLRGGSAPRGDSPQRLGPYMDDEVLPARWGARVDPHAGGARGCARAYIALQEHRMRRGSCALSWAWARTTNPFWTPWYQMRRPSKRAVITTRACALAAHARIRSHAHTLTHALTRTRAHAHIRICAEDVMVCVHATASDAPEIEHLLSPEYLAAACSPGGPAPTETAFAPSSSACVGADVHVERCSGRSVTACMPTHLALLKEAFIKA